MSDPMDTTRDNEDYPKFPLMSAMFGPRHAQQEPYPVGPGALMVIPDTTNDHLAEIATQLRIANQIAYLSAHPGIPSAVVREQIEKGLGL